MNVPCDLANLRFSSQSEFETFRRAAVHRLQEFAAYEAALAVEGETFSVPGHCQSCDKDVQFHVDYRYSYAHHGSKRLPNWREHLVCPGCGLNNRMRGALAFMRTFVSKYQTLYITEQRTPLFRRVAQLFPLVIGSEFLNDGTPLGAIRTDGVRHEDVTRLSFTDESVGHICTYDVLEHVPDYRKAIREFFRCMQAGGTLAITVPFLLDFYDNLTRAKLLPSGAVEHICPPEYHGDPLNQSGILCFHHFGWELLEDLKLEGFVDACLRFYWSARFGYLGGPQFVISARKF